MSCHRILSSLTLVAACGRPQAPVTPVPSCWFELEPKASVAMFAVAVAGDLVLLHGDADVKLTRYRATGSTAWEVPIVRADRHYDAMALDAAGDVLVTGWIDRPQDVADADLPGCFVAKWSGADGHAIWTTTLTGTGAQLCRGIDAEPAGDVFVTGFFAGTLDAPGGPLTSHGMSDVLVARLAGKDGTPRWIRQIGGGGDDVGRVVVVDHHGDVIIGGNFSQGVAPEVGAIGAMISAGDADGLLVKLTADGEPVWSRGFGDVGWDIVKSIAIDRDDSVFLSGAWMRPQDFHGALPFMTGVHDGLVARYTRDGQLVWRKVFGGGGSQAHHVALDDRGRLWVIGHFKGGSVTLPGRMLEAAGESTVYLAGFTSAGVLTSAEIIGAPGGQYGYGVAATAEGLVIGGTGKGEGRFCGRVRAGSPDGYAFVARFSP